MASWIYRSGTAGITTNSPTVTLPSGVVALTTKGDKIRFGTTDENVRQAASYLIIDIPTTTTVTTFDPVVEATNTAIKFIIEKTSIDRHDSTFLVGELEDFNSTFGALIDITGNDRVFRLNKAGSGDYAGALLQVAGADVAKFGLLTNNEFKLQMWASSQWNDILVTAALALNFPQTTDASAVSAAAVNVLGSFSVVKKSFFGDDLTVTKAGAGIYAWDSTSYATGVGGLLALQGKNAAGTPARTTFAQLSAYGTAGTGGAETGDLVFKTRNAGTLTEWLRLTGAGVLHHQNTTEASAYNVAAAYFDGGVGIAKKLIIGSTAAAISTITGSLINAGGFGNAGAAFFGSTVTMANTGANTELVLSNVSSDTFAGGFNSAYAMVIQNKYNVDGNYTGIQFNDYSNTAICGITAFIASQASHYGRLSFMVRTASSFAYHAMDIANGVCIGGTTLPTGGFKGDGNLNLAGDVYKNNTAYTNPDFVLEKYYTGAIVKFADRERAHDYQGLMPLAQLRDYTRNNLRLPRVTDDPAGMFERGDIALELIEGAHLYILELHDRVCALEATAH